MTGSEEDLRVSLEVERIVETALLRYPGSPPFLPNNRAKLREAVFAALLRAKQRRREPSKPK